MEQFDLDDGTADRFLLNAAGVSLLVFYSAGCGDCRLARARLPEMNLPVQRICWIDAGANAGLAERYEVFHLPSMFVTRDGVFYGPVQATLNEWDIRRQLALAQTNHPAELP
ncbi:thioredoxin family protein [Pigmentiphaga soli]|uniref:Thioredoxin family protein n=1 Tax=Pigmentiphaga soli TaxID=1007095 RepID=A0ABP8H2A6_9BURK